MLADALQVLVDDGMLVLSDAGTLSSKFILLQLSERSTLSKARSKAGRKGGKAKQLNRRSNCQASVKQNLAILEPEPEPEPEVENNPPSPQRGDGDGVEKKPKKKRLTVEEKKRMKVESNSDLMNRIGKWFGRKPTTPWAIYEAEALAQCLPVDGGDIRLLEIYYTSERRDDEEDYRRKAVAQLLNNFSTEIDRARSYKPKRTTPIAAARAKSDSEFTRIVSDLKLCNGSAAIWDAICNAPGELTHRLAKYAADNLGFKR